MVDTPHTEQLQSNIQPSAGAEIPIDTTIPLSPIPIAGQVASQKIPEGKRIKIPLTYEQIGTYLIKLASRLLEEPDTVIDHIQKVSKKAGLGEYDEFIDKESLIKRVGELAYSGWYLIENSEKLGSKYDAPRREVLSGEIRDGQVKNLNISIDALCCCIEPWGIPEESPLLVFSPLREYSSWVEHIGETIFPKKILDSISPF